MKKQQKERKDGPSLLIRFIREKLKLYYYLYEFILKNKYISYNYLLKNQFLNLKNQYYWYEIILSNIKKALFDF